MLGFVTKLVGDGGSAPTEPEETGDRDERPAARLYECPDCESVYLSLDLEDCRTCGTGVERVPSERDLGFGTGQ